MRLSLPHTAFPFTVVLLLPWYDMDIVDMRHQVVHVALFLIYTALPETFGHLNVVGRVGVFRVGLSCGVCG
jgi:hypothetical protein